MLEIFNVGINNYIKSRLKTRLADDCMDDVLLPSPTNILSDVTLNNLSFLN